MVASKIKKVKSQKSSSNSLLYYKYFEDEMQSWFPHEILIPEYKFHVANPLFFEGKKRQWRFDYAILEKRIAIELEGGVFGFGRHNRASGYISDTIKYNQATILGWKIIRIIPSEFVKDIIYQKERMEEIKILIELNKKERED